jgi:hypothetical protein
MTYYPARPSPNCIWLHALSEKSVFLDTDVTVLHSMDILVQASSYH